ncbi:MAG TPA: type II CAAX endopeptidase family protein [Leptolyngbya sp.]|jgi:membrane protease YdiL (CAAX protease family)|nr:type II CAAX endopeptidase family protein [Leptolyngbya sp.]
MTPKRILLWGLTLVAIAAIALDLISSWNEPQFQSRLELSQTDLLLQAAQYQGDKNTAALTDRDPQKTALEAYQKTRSSVDKAINSAQSQILASPAPNPAKPLTVELAKQKTLRDELDIRIGILQTQQKQVDAALKSWASLTDSQTQTSANLRSTAATLTALWRDALPPRAEPILQQNLTGWFRNRALEKLYTLEQRSDALSELRTAEQADSQQALVKWVSANAVPTIALILGFVLLLFLAGQWVIKRKQSLLAGTNAIEWTVPWDYEITWQVLVVGFFAVGQLLIGQVLLPVGLLVAKSSFQLNPAAFTVRDRAFLALVTYLLLAAGGLGVLYLSIKRFLPIERNWFRFSLKGRWLLWGVGGYAAAYPLVAGVSWINEKIWQGRGGSNPLLSIALEGRDTIALVIFFITAAIAAPLFEETFFRGFLLPSLTKYFTTWQAILLSSLIFAIVHLSLSEVLPLTVLGIILGFVYTRTQNLMASVLLHALWNSGTLLTLFLLGSAAG